MVVAIISTNQSVCQAQPWITPEDPPGSEDPHFRSAGYFEGWVHP